MTNSDNEIRELLAELVRKQNTTQDQILQTQSQLNNLTDDVNRVLARSAVLDDVLLELRDSHERHQQNLEDLRTDFQDNQRTTNAALQSLEAILLQLIRNNQRLNN